MNEQAAWDERYRSANPSWDTRRHDSNLERMLRAHHVEPCLTLEIGCGTGSNAIWLAQQGFEVTASDFSPIAIQTATQRAVEAKVGVRFSVGDVLKDVPMAQSYDLVFDRGCFHTFAADADRRRCVEYVWKSLCEGGLWLSLIGSADGPKREVGPPQLSLREVVEAIEPRFELLHVEAGCFDSDLAEPPRAWVCLMRARYRSSHG